MTTQLERMTTEQFLKLNANTQSYFDFWRWKPEGEDWTKDERARSAAQIDLDIFNERLNNFDANPSAKVGDWIRGYDGKMTRFTHAWNDGIQTGGGMGSFYLCSNGHASYSGGLDSSVPYDLIELTGEYKDGQFWIFHKEYSGAHRGVYYNHPCRVWRVKTITDIGQIKRLPYQYKVAEVTEEVYHDALGAVPPIAWEKSFFAMGEPYSHAGVVPTYYCFVKINGKFYCTVATIEAAKEAFNKMLTN